MNLNQIPSEKLEKSIKKPSSTTNKSQSINSSTTKITQFSIKKSNITTNNSKRRQSSKSSSSSVVPVKLRYTSNLHMNISNNKENKENNINTKANISYIISNHKVNIPNTINNNKQLNTINQKEPPFEKEIFSKSQIFHRQTTKSIDSDQRNNQSSQKTQLNQVNQVNQMGITGNNPEIIKSIYVNYKNSLNKTSLLLIKDKEDKYQLRKKEKTDRNERNFNLFNKSNVKPSRNPAKIQEVNSKLNKNEDNSNNINRKSKDKSHISSFSIIDRIASMNSQRKDHVPEKKSNMIINNISYTSNISNISNINTITNSNSTTNNRNKYQSFLKYNKINSNFINDKTENTEKRQSITNIQVFKYNQPSNLNQKPIKTIKPTEKPYKLIENTTKPSQIINKSTNNYSNDLSLYKNKSTISTSKQNLKLTLTKRPSFQVNQPATCSNFNKNLVFLNLNQEKTEEIHESKVKYKGNPYEIRGISKNTQSRSSLNVLKVSSSLISEVELKKVKTELRIGLNLKRKDYEKVGGCNNNKTLRIKSILDMKNSRNNKELLSKQSYLNKNSSNTLFNFSLKREKTEKEEKTQTKITLQSEVGVGVGVGYSLTEENKDYKYKTNEDLKFNNENKKRKLNTHRDKLINKTNHKINSILTHVSNKDIDTNQTLSLQIKDEPIKKKLSSFNFMIFLEKPKQKSCLLSFLLIKDAFNLLVSAKEVYFELKSLFKKETIKKILQFNNENRVFLWKSIYKYSNLHSNYQTQYLIYLSETISEKDSLEKMTSEEKVKTRLKFQYIHQIEKDVVRTFPKDVTYKDKEMIRLRNVLYAYASYNKTIGYAQGMNYIIANALFVLKNEEDAFIFFDSIVNYLSLTDIFSIKNENLDKILMEVEFLTKKHVKKLVFYLKSLSLKPDFITTPWLLSLYSTSVDKDYLYKIWDLMMIYGWRFLINFTISVLNQYENYICGLDSFLLSQEIRNLLKTDLFYQSFPHIVNKAFELESISVVNI